MQITSKKRIIKGKVSCTWDSCSGTSLSSSRDLQMGTEKLPQSRGRLDRRMHHTLKNRPEDTISGEEVLGIFHLTLGKISSNKDVS